MGTGTNFDYLQYTYALARDLEGLSVTPRHYGSSVAVAISIKTYINDLNVFNNHHCRSVSWRRETT